MTFPCWQCLSFGLNPRIYNSNKGKEVPSILRQKRKQLVPNNEKQRWSSGLWTETSGKESNCSFWKALSAFEKIFAFSPAQHEDFWRKYMPSKLQSSDRREGAAFLYQQGRLSHGLCTVNTNGCKLRPRKTSLSQKHFSARRTQYWIDMHSKITILCLKEPLKIAQAKEHKSLQLSLRC